VAGKGRRDESGKTWCQLVKKREGVVEKTSRVDASQGGREYFGKGYSVGSRMEVGSDGKSPDFPWILKRETIMANRKEKG